MKKKSKKIISYGVAFAIIIIGAIWIFNKIGFRGDVEYTDNAQVRQQIVPVISRVQGFVKEIRYKEFQPVRKGDTLIVIDDTDLRLQVAHARADYNNALASRGVAETAIGVASANASVSEASLAEAKVLLENAEIEFRRYESLLAQGAVTRQQFDAVKTDMEAKRARYQTLTRQIKVASNVVGESNKKIAQNEASIELAKVRMEAAEVNLGYTVIVAPCDGFTTRKEVQVGQFVQPGQTLLDMVDSSEIWVSANYKETQIGHIFPGSTVKIKIDAIPGVTYYGTVEAISEATGASLSLLPQDNSAGNFVKVRQRIPVRIVFSPGNKPEDMKRLRAGMNAECEVIYKD